MSSEPRHVRTSANAAGTDALSHVYQANLNGAAA